MTAPVELRFRSQPENLKRVREAVKRHVTACGAGPGCAEDVVLAVDEACQNVIRHAYGEQADGEILLRIASK